MKQITSSGFETEVLRCSTPVLIDFCSADCPPCHTLAPNLQGIEDESGDSLKVVKVDIAREPDLANSFQIRAVPTVVLFSNGRQVAQFTDCGARKQSRNGSSRNSGRSLLEAQLARTKKVGLPRLNHLILPLIEKWASSTSVRQRCAAKSLPGKTFLENLSLVA